MHMHVFTSFRVILTNREGFIKSENSRKTMSRTSEHEFQNKYSIVEIKGVRRLI
jgi:hypothetical protein